MTFLTRETLLSSQDPAKLERKMKGWFFSTSIFNPVKWRAILSRVVSAAAVGKRE